MDDVPELHIVLLDRRDLPSLGDETSIIDVAATIVNVVPNEDRIAMSIFDAEAVLREAGQIERIASGESSRPRSPLEQDLKHCWSRSKELPWRSGSRVDAVRPPPLH